MWVSPRRAACRPRNPLACDQADLAPRLPLAQVFDIRGRYGTYGKVDSMTVTMQKAVEEGGREYKYVDYKFTTLSPGGRDIDRNGCIKLTVIDGDIIMFVASSNSNRWKNVKATIADSLTTFSAALAPKVGGHAIATSLEHTLLHTHSCTHTHTHQHQDTDSKTSPHCPLNPTRP